jgi:hypothetical protein
MNSDPFRFYTLRNNSDSESYNNDIRFGHESLNSRDLNKSNKPLSQEQIEYNTLVEQTFLMNKGYDNIIEELLKLKLEFDKKRKNNENIDDANRFIILSLNEKKQNFKKQINENMDQIIIMATLLKRVGYKVENQFTHVAIYDKKNTKWNFVRKK